MYNFDNLFFLSFQRYFQPLINFVTSHSTIEQIELMGELKETAASKIMGNERH